MKNYKIGLDIGIKSVGWSVLECNETGEPISIIDKGVRIFEAAEVPKNGESLMAKRREARSIRRILRRKRLRLQDAKNLIKERFNVSDNWIESLFNEKQLENIYELRYKALSKKLKKEEFSRLLIHFLHKRGFKSNRKVEDKKGETGKLLKATKENSVLMEEKGYKTIGELIYKETRKEEIKKDGTKIIKFFCRNKPGNYKYTFLRNQIEDEIKYIFKKQFDLENDFANENFLKEYLSIFNRQRSFEEGPGNPSKYANLNGFEKLIGICTFENIKNGREKDEPRSSKNSYGFERFNLINKLNNLRLNQSGNVFKLSIEQKEKIIELAYKKDKLTYHDIRKNLNLPIDENGEGVIFQDLNYDKKILKRDKNKKPLLDEFAKKQYEYKPIDEIENQTFISLKGYHTIKKALDKIEKDYIKKLNKEKIDIIAYTLSIFKSPDNIKKYLLENDFTEKESEIISQYCDNLNGFCHLSLKAIYKLLPYIENGMDYDKACEQVGYDFQNKFKNKKSNKLNFNDISEELKNPVVKRSISQTFKVINAIIRKYGNPYCISIELARELGKTFDERQDLQKDMLEKNKENEKLMCEIKEIFNLIKPTGSDLVKYKLWKEQKQTCAYSLKPIPAEILFKPNSVQVDHIIPYSQSFDDSYNNKVLVLTEENQHKGNTLPLIYMGINTPKAEAFKIWVHQNIMNKKKKNNLLKTEITEDLKTRNLVDTQYATKLIANFIENNLIFKDADSNRQKVIKSKGIITSYIRKRFGFNKSRDTDNHHAEDAILIAACSQGLIQKITNYEKLNRDYIYIAKENKFVNKLTGEVFNNLEDFRINLKNNLLQFPEPWINFRNDFIKHTKNTNDPFDTNSEIKPIFVSRMSNHKITGKAHKETIYKQGEVLDKNGKKQIKNIKRVALVELKLVKINGNYEIENYYNKESDNILYNALLQQLIKFNGNAKEAFKKIFYKPKKDINGDYVDGNEVKKVSIIDNRQSDFKLERVGGYVNNGDMIRIDVFTKPNKKTGKDEFYFIPIYVADFLKKELPNKAVVNGKSKENWIEMDSTYKFRFSLYSGDLIYIETEKGEKGKTIDINSKEDESKNINKTIKNGFFYYVGADISTARITFESHNRDLRARIGVKTLKDFNKFEVDVLGNINKYSYRPRETKTLRN